MKNANYKHAPPQLFTTFIWPAESIYLAGLIVVEPKHWLSTTLVGIRHVYRQVLAGQNLRDPPLGSTD